MLPIACGLILLAQKADWPPLVGPKNGPIICIDPGHPSEVGNGTKGKSITEIHAAWVVGLKVKDLLVKKGYRVVLTKTKEMELVKNRRRAEVANHYKADFMLRLHCDDGNKSGLAVYYPDRAIKLQGHEGPPPQIVDKSTQFAKVFHAKVIESLKGQIGDAGLHTDKETFVGSKQGGLTGSVFSDVPVVLVEMAVLGNAHDDQFMASKEGQDIMAKALVEATVAVVKPIPGSR